MLPLTVVLSACRLLMPAGDAACLLARCCCHSLHA
jgi:hypothetical protein